MGYTRSGTAIDKSSTISESAYYDSDVDVAVVVEGGPLMNNKGMDPRFKVKDGRIVLVTNTVTLSDSYASLYK